MPLAQDIYDTLVKDPDLDIGENQTREEAAQTEADFRARQYVNNVRALSLATAPLEKVSPIKALLQHVSSLSAKLPDIVKAGISQVTSKESFSLKSNPVTKVKYDTLPQAGKDFFDSMSEAGIEPSIIENAFTSIHGAISELAQKQPNLMDISDDQWVFDQIHKIASDPEHANILGLTTAHVQNLTEGAWLQKFPNAVPPPPPFKGKQGMIDKAKSFYGDNTEEVLHSAASPEKINAALETAKSEVRVKFGGTGKLKLVTPSGQDVDTQKYHNPFGKDQIRLFASNIEGKAADNENDVITDATLSTLSVADVMNGIHWLKGQETSEQVQEVVEAHKVEEEAINKADVFETAVEKETPMPTAAVTPHTPAPIGYPDPHSVGKAPFVMFGSWGYQKHGKHGMDAPHEVQHQAHGQGLKHGICNELGQVNKVGQALIQAAVEGGSLKKGLHYADFGTHMVLKSKGVKALLDHHGIDELSGNINKSVAMEIAGMELMADELPEGLNWKSAIQSVFDKMPEDGVPQTPQAEAKLQALVDDTAKELKVSPTPDIAGNKAKALLADIFSKAVRLNQAYTADSENIQGHLDKLTNSVDEAGTAEMDEVDTPDFGEGGILVTDTLAYLLDPDKLGEILTHISNNTTSSNFSLDNHPSVAEHVEKTEYLETLKNVAAAHVDAEVGSAGWDSSLQELHIAMDNAEDAGVDVLEIDTAVKDSMKEVAAVQGVLPGDLDDFVTTGMPQVNWKADEVVEPIDEGQASLSAGIADGVSSADNQELHSLMTEVVANETGAVDALNNKIKELQSTGVTPSNIEYSLEKHGWDIGGHTSGDLKDKGVNFPSEEETPDLAGATAHATLVDKAENLFNVHEHDYTGEGLSDEEIQAKKDEASQAMKDATNALASATSPEAAEKAANKYLADNHQAHFGSSDPDTVTTWLDDKEIGGVVEPDAPKAKAEAPVGEEPKITIHDSGDTNWLVGDKVTVAEFEAANKQMVEVEGGLPASSDDYDKEPSVTTPKVSAEEEAPSKPNLYTKMDKVMTAHFGDDWEEQALDDPDIQDVMDHYIDNEEDIEADYKKHHIDAIKNKAIDAKEDKVTAEEDSKQAAEDKLKEEADSLPSEPDDLDDMATLDKKETVTPEVATSQARELLAHQKKHKDNMSSEAKNKLAKGLINAMKHGANIDQLKDEMDTEGDNFGSPEHLQEAHEKDMQKVAFKNKHEELISGESGQQAREDAFHAGAHNKFTEFDEYGDPKHDIHVEADENGKAKKFNSHEPKDYTDHEESQKKFHTDKGHTLSDSHMLHELDPMQQKRHDDYKDARGEQHKAVAAYDKIDADPNSSTEDLQKADAKAEETADNVASSRKALEDSGVSMKDVDNEDDTPKSGPPDPEVAKQKIAQGYVWHEETRHWILKDTLKELQGGHGGHDASIVSAGHAGAAGKSGAFALDEHGNSAFGSKFVYHGSGNLMKVGDGKPPTGGSASNSTIAGNALHSQLSSGGHLDAHNALTGISKIPNFTHPTKGSAGSSGIATKATKDVPDSKLGSAMDNLKEGKGLGLTSFMDNLFSKKGYPMPKGSALALFIKAYGSHDAMKHKKEVQELLERVSEGEEESDENSVEKGIISYR